MADVFPIRGKIDGPIAKYQLQRVPLSFRGVYKVGRRQRDREDFAESLNR